jgi:hypothetical protein
MSKWEIKPIKPPEEISYSKPSYEALPTSVLTENRFLPKELENECPVSVSLYNLYESVYPTSGHIAVIIATALASMWTDEKRQFNLILAALPTEGKSSVLQGFAAYPWINLFTTTTFAEYLTRYCGKFLDTSMPLGKEIPRGVRIERLGDRKIISTEGCEDRITYFFDVVHAGEGITSFGNYEKLLQLWSGLIEDGYWEGGTRFSGSYKIGSFLHPVRHGLILACTIDDLKNKWMKEEGMLSRAIVCRYKSREEENEWIRKAKAPPQPLLPKPEKINFPLLVQSHLKHLGPHLLHRKMTFSPAVDESVTKNITYLITEGREEPTIKRATDDTMRILKGHARLNRRDKVVLEDIIFCEALLQMCRPFEKDEISGDRLQFQCAIRRLLYGGDIKRVKREIMETFKEFGKNDPLYKEPVIDRVLTQKVGLEAYR